VTLSTATVTVTIIVAVDDPDSDVIRVDALTDVGPVDLKSRASPANDDVDCLAAVASNEAPPETGLPVYSAGLPPPSTSRSIRRKLAVAVAAVAVLIGVLWLSQPDRRPPAAGPAIPTSIAEPDAASSSTPWRDPNAETPSSADLDCTDVVPFAEIPCAQAWPNALTPDADVGVSP
jgi:hypothetical protein